MKRSIALAALLAAVAQAQTEREPSPAPAPSTAAAPVPGAYDVVARVAAFNTSLAGVRPGAAWPVQLPTAPTIVSRVTVSTASAMAAAQSMSRVEVTFAGPGFTGTLRPGTDQRWIFPAGFTLTAPADGYALDVSAARRVELVGQGGNVVGAMTGNGTQDLRIRGLDVRTRTNSSQAWYDMHVINGCTRVLIEGGYFVARSYALIYDGCNSLVVANSEFHSAGAGATTRGAGNDLVLWMDSRLVTAGNQQQFRAHRRSGRVAAFGLQIEGGTGSYFGSAGDGCPSVDDLVMLDNRYYGQGDTIFTEGCVTGGVFVGNHGYSPWGGGSQIPLNAPAGSIVRNNPRLPYQAPPPWSSR